MDSFILNIRGFSLLGFLQNQKSRLAATDLENVCDFDEDIFLEPSLTSRV